MVTGQPTLFDAHARPTDPQRAGLVADTGLTRPGAEGCAQTVWMVTR